MRVGVLGKRRGWKKLRERVVRGEGGGGVCVPNVRILSVA